MFLNVKLSVIASGTKFNACSETSMFKFLNPFLRTSVDQVKENAENYANKQNLQPVEILAAIRDWKDNF